MSATTLLTAELVWRPVIAPMHILALAAVLGVLAVLAYLRAARLDAGRAIVLGVMRLAAIAVLAGLLMGPSIIPPHDTEPDGGAVLTVLLDTSGSMLTDDAPAGRTRLDHLRDRWLTDEQVRRLGERFDLRLVAFDESARSITPAALDAPAEAIATGRATHYASTLSDALLDIPRERPEGHALLVIGDGHDTEDRPLGPAASLAAERGVPIHALAVGEETSPPNLALLAIPRQAHLMAGEEGRIMVRIEQAGFDDATATVRLRGEGADEARRVPFDGRPNVTLDLPVRHEEPGVYEYTIAADPLPGQVSTERNEHTVFVEVTERRARVLLLEGEPFWDTKFLAQSLRLDPRVELVQITQVSPSRRDRITTRVDDDAPPEVPESLEELSRYEVVILGRGLERLLDAEAAALLERYVDDGGGHVIFARGRPYDESTEAGRAIGEAIGPLEPVVFARGLMHRVPIALTAAGRSSPAFSFVGMAASAEELVEALPPLAVIHEVERVKPATIVLAEAGGEAAGGAEPGDRPPVLAVMNHGRGRVFAVLGEGLWRWSFLPPDRTGHEGVFDAFWSNTVRWLATGGEFQPGEGVSLNLSRSSVRLGDPLQVDVATRLAPPEGFDPRLEVIDPDGEARPLALAEPPGRQTRRQASFVPDKPGVWRIVLEADPLEPERQERRFSVYDVDVERLRPEARPEALRELAERTGGLFFDAADAPADLAERFERHRMARIVPPTPRDAWPHGLLLAGLLVWIGLEWIGRRSTGWL